MAAQMSPARAAIWRLTPLRIRRSYQYWQKFGRVTTFRHPRTFTEKVNWRILHDRRPLIAMCCDKLATKEYVLARGGVEVAPLIWFGTSLDEFAAQDRGPAWVLKPNHRGGGIVHFGSGTPQARQLRETTRDWMEPEQAVTLGEWGYTRARRAYIAEQRIGDIVLNDYKFFVFHGVPRLIQVDSTRFVAHERRLYEPDWTPLEHQVGHPVGPVLEPPPHLTVMLEMAGRLAEPFDFVRVDLYDTPTGVYFGELTPYPAGGLEPYSPADLDQILGEYWQLPAADTLEAEPGDRHA